MSLLVHLPLNGDTHNQGLSNLVAINNGATVNNNGKIGKCYQFGTAASDISLPAAAMTGNTTECSVCFWLNILTWNTAYATFFQAGLASAPWTSYIFGLLRNNTASTCCFTISNGSSASNANYLTPTFDLNKWYHVALIYKTGHCLIYINGQLYQDYTTSIVPNFAGITTIKLGRCTNGSSYQTNCLMNDFRIYDHALSPKEVEEIAKGLVLHYKLDQNLNVLNNCYSTPTFNTSSSSGGWNHWGQSGSSGTYGQNTDKQFIFNKNNNYSHWVMNASTATGNYLLYQSPAFDGGFRSLQVILKEEDGAPINESIVVPDWNARNGGAAINIWTSITSLGDGFYLCKCEGISQSGSNDLVGLYIKPGYKVYISEAYLENDREICSDIFNQNNLTTIYDSSGYSHNGTIIGSLTAAAGSPRYEVCTHFDGVTNCIIVPYKEINPDGIFTLNLWFYKDALGSKNYETLFGGPSGFEMDTRAGASTSLSLYMASTRGSTVYSGADFSLNQWVMVTLVRDGINELYYINGKLKKTIEAKSMPEGDYRIGAWASNTGQNFYGNISDFRIYATALTADQVKELYNTSMSVDSNGNVYARKLSEL